MAALTSGETESQEAANLEGEPLNERRGRDDV